MDFTLSTYHKLLTTLQDKGFAFLPFCEFLERPAGRAVALRHDVDKRPHYALKMAKLEHQMGICGTYDPKNNLTMFYNIKSFVTFVIGRWSEPSPIQSDHKKSKITNPSGLSLKHT